MKITHPLKGIIRIRTKKRQFRIDLDRLSEVSLWAVATIAVIFMVTILIVGAVGVSWVEYHIHNGDTLDAIVAENCDGVIDARYKTILENNIYDADKLRAGDILLLPVRGK